MHTLPEAAITQAAFFSCLPRAGGGCGNEVSVESYETVHLEQDLASLFLCCNVFVVVLCKEFSCHPIFLNLHHKFQNLKAILVSRLLKQCLLTLWFLATLVTFESPALHL